MQTAIVFLILALAGVYLFFRFRRSVSGGGCGCGCGSCSCAKKGGCTPQGAPLERSGAETSGPSCGRNG
ncbi:FeoB-associated Cys-rich membrane protein [Mailhella massiliensis]|uniref:FeoB-associated Cys-rich membrane protein n=1 Tax=Mailhella massiliensis TaxID=1903261 RepID=A0A921AUN7_9BACT|nr:FeoB-associated Cys-rich membrane protein [Mailhella massiliensis]HJD96127.1 FeoB-associated Cys-rich membrane protein [Mailhella massiliensis]